ELGGEEVVLVFDAESVRTAAIAHDAGGGDPAEVFDGGLAVPCGREPLPHFIPGICPPLYREDDAIVARPLIVQDIDGDQRLPLVGEGDLDRIVHDADADDLDLAAVGLAAEDAGGLALGDAAVLLDDLMPMPAVAS